MPRRYVRRTLLVALVALPPVLAGAATPAAAASRPPCTLAALNTTVQAVQRAAGGSDKAKLHAGDFRCSGNWAVAFPVIVFKGGADTITEVFKASGAVWVRHGRGGAVCKSPGHEVPAPIFRDACESN